MSNFPNVAAEAGDKYLAMLAQGQDQFVEFVRSSKELMPRVPANFEAPAQGMPFDVPSPREIAEAQFHFATKLLQQQEKFIRRLYSLPTARATSKPAASGTAKRTSTSSRRSPRRSKASS